MNYFNKIYRFCNLFKYDPIKQEFDEQIKNYSLNNIEKKPNKYICSFANDKDEHIGIIVELNNISIIKNSTSRFEKIFFDDNLLILHRIIEKRTNGIIYSIVEKKFNLSRFFDNKIILFELFEYRHTFSIDTLKLIIDNYSFNEDSLGKVYLKLCELEHTGFLKKTSDFSSEFSSRVNYSMNIEDKDKIKHNVYPTKTYLNDEEVSSIYNIQDSEDKIYRVYDLYRGIINKRNEIDINSINLGLLSQNSFDLKSLKGITEQENNIVGKKIVDDLDDYINYLKKLFENNFGYCGDLKLDRNSILNGIIYQMPFSKMLKQQIEKKTKIPYEEFRKLSKNKQYRLINKK